MTSRLAAIAIAWPRRVALLGLLLLAVAGIIGGPAPGVFKAHNDFEDPGSQAAAARTAIGQATGAASSPGVIALVDAAPGSPAVASVVATLSGDQSVARVNTPPAASANGRATAVAAILRADADDSAVASRLEADFASRSDVHLGGGAIAGPQVGATAAADLGFAEALAFPLLALLALLIFRGIAALLPLLVGAASVLTTFMVLRLINTQFSLSIFCLNLVIGLGLGLAVDYSLFMVSRFREEIGRGSEVADAVRTTLATAGHTVIFSALTVAAAMASLTVFPLRFLQSMGIGGMVVALVAAAVSLVFLPALMLLMGRRIGKHVPGPEGQGRWYTLALAVMRRPALVAGATAAVMIALAVPSLQAHWSGVDASILPTSRSARVVSDRLAAEFPGVDASPAVIAVSAAENGGSAVRSYAATVAATPDVTGVGPPRYLGSATWLIQASVGGVSTEAQAQDAITALRALPAPFTVAIGGAAADFHDQQAALGHSLPLALAILALTTLVILWLMTGSVILPIKAVVMNILTVGAATGILVLVFQNGNLTGLLSYRSQGGLEPTDFLVLVALVFALSTDYGVFLLTRIKEARASGLEGRNSVAAGLQHTGAIVTAAAILLAVAIGAFSTSHVIFLKEIGVGTAAAVLLDAFVVRSFLVPSLMAMLGDWNWWQPRFLSRLHRRVGIREVIPTPAR